MSTSKLMACATALAVLGAPLSLLIPAMQSAASEVIKLEQLNGVFRLPVRVNDVVEVPFVVDTGAGEVAIPDDVLSTLKRTGTVSGSDFIGTGTYTLADGSTTKSDRYVLHKMRVGDHIVADVVANVVSSQGEPLLGQSFLSKLPAWRIDYVQPALVFDDERGNTTEQKQTAAIEQPLQAYSDGLAARKAWVQYFSKLSSRTKEGADWWALRRTDPSASCYFLISSKISDGDLERYDGCVSAKQQLAPIDERRCNEPAYSTGWDAYDGAPLTPPLGQQQCKAMYPPSLWESVGNSLNGLRLPLGARGQ
jgi:clan AA aspartic protease (TIGR02281 family)